ncbi:hypothetical protein NSK_002793 [Nannochloropsis salina CCMP1776]|jgi:hypothetical protein|uniref:GOLD domain-containing protein n=1 Tax=Nannochloropsis salina CCMP1776 TaxID=1027361 RepID=A0A4D9D7I6_9STRA|nr:hypothetical protein NSK_002793 [Nannochloropsis salina CCMP1776]|eukprot:TFJ85973.1 hypothetical protein NSK_002793 [Nannochloropsis salina CCMP1776]
MALSRRRPRPLDLALPLFVLFLIPSPTHPLSLEVPPRDKVCLYQYYDVGETGKAEVFVVNGGNLDIGVSVEGPFTDDVHGTPSKTTQETKTVYDAIVASSSAFLNQVHPAGVTVSPDGVEISWPAQPGAYALCLDNTMSHVQTKVIEFSFPASKEGAGTDDFDLDAALAAANEGSGTNDTISENIKQSYKADLALLKRSAQRIGRTLTDVQHKQVKERHRLALQTAANQKNHQKMVVSSVFETVVFIGVSLFQLFWVRRWFEGRGLRARSREWA